ncbi:MAG: ABC transporter ATP-binding protein [Planctomycetota bacterium]|nr:ABC transporter ATP-binding protein [Planctomycetota bacterium]
MEIEDQKKSSGIRRLLGYAFPHYKSIIAILLLMCIYAGANSLRLGAVGLVIDGVISPSDDGSRGRTLALFEDFLLPYLPGDIQLPERIESRFRIDGALVVGFPSVDPDDPLDGELDQAWDQAFLVTAQLRDGGTVQDIRASRIRLDGVFDAKIRSITAAQLSGFDIDPGDRSPDSAVIAEIDGSGHLLIQNGLPGTGSLQLLWSVSLFIAALSLVVATSSFYRLILGQRVRIQVVVDIRNQLFRFLSCQSLEYFESRRHGDVVSRAVGDVTSVSASVQLLFGEILQSPLTILFSLGVAFIASWQMTAAAIPLLLLLAIPVFRQAKKVRTRFRGALSHAGETTEGLSQLLSGIRVVKSFGLEDQRQKEFEKTSENLRRAQVSTEVARAKGRSLVEGLYNLIAAFAIAAGGWVITDGIVDVTFGDFAVFMAAILSCYTPIKNLARMATTIAESSAATDRIFEVLDTPRQVVDGSEARSMLPFSRAIEFRDVSHRYAADAGLALDGIQLTIKKGERVALVGPSGSGKSTLFDILARFREPSGGEIYFDGIEYRDLTHSSLLDQIAIVGQEPFLFHSTVKENIGGGNPAATDDQIEAAARAASVHEEIEALPSGYNTVIGERGDRLSGGQRQRITIARAILKDAPILLLDEATASLDSEGEQRVHRALQQLMEDRTVLVVAHRLSTVRDVDRVVVLDGGRIVEQGTDEQLRSAGGLYARLSAIQEAGLAEGRQ